MKKIILHIGAPKTATTLIQRCLEKSSLPLADLGICVCDFLGSSNHKLLSCTFREKTWASHSRATQNVSFGIKKKILRFEQSRFNC